jgi:hypothetical protein
MYRIALDIATSFVRGNSLRERHTVTLDEAHDTEDSSVAPAEEDERARLLHTFIARFDELNRALLLLYLDDRYRDMAAILGISETNVAAKIGRSKHRFAREIARTEGDLLVGAAGIAGTLWYRRLWAEPADSERRRSVEERASGKSFRDAQHFLGELARFERE